MSTTSRWRLLPGIRIVAENWFARRAGRELLDLYQRVRREEPSLNGRDLYVRILSHRYKLEAQEAAAIVRRAEESFCDWTSGRELLRFRDVVQYVVVEEYLRLNPSAIGTHVDIGEAVARTIPANL